MDKRKINKIIQYKLGGMTQEAICEKLKVCKTTIYRIVNQYATDEQKAIIHEQGRKNLRSAAHPTMRQLDIHEAGEILQEYRQSRRIAMLARMHDVSRTTIYNIVNGITYKELQKR